MMYSFPFSLPLFVEEEKEIKDIGTDTDDGKAIT